MPVRAFRERIFQCICLQVGGILLASPLFAWIFDISTAESGFLITAMTLVELAWNPFHDMVFDHIEWGMTGRPASSRPYNLRIVHAITHELSAMVVTLPVLVLVGGLGLMDALLFDLGSCVFYAVYVLAFFRIYDWMRPLAV